MTESSAQPTADIRTLVDLIGFRAATALLDAKGGQRIYVPENQDAASSRVLVEIVGEAAAAALRLKFGGTAIDLPIGPSATDPFWKRHSPPATWMSRAEADELLLKKREAQRELLEAEEAKRKAQLRDAAPQRFPDESVKISLQEQRELLQGLLIGSGKSIDLPVALTNVLDDFEQSGRNALHFLADHLGRDGGKRVFMTLVLAYPNFVLEALDDGEG